MKQFTHEGASSEEKVEAGSDRSFGIVMAVALAAVTLLNSWHSGSVWPWTGVLAALLLTAGLVRPSLLRPNSYG